MSDPSSGPLPVLLVEDDPADAEFVLLRLADEGLHVDGQRAEEAAAVEGGQLVLEIRDDGRGIPKEALDDPHSFGPIGMRKRVAAR